MIIEAVDDEIIITAASDSREYNGTALTSSEFTYTSGILAEGDVLYVQTDGSITHFGTTENTVTSRKVMRGDTDVTANYTFGTPVSGTLEITKAKVTITAASDSREYNGTALTNSGWEITRGAVASGDSISVTVTGSQLDVGSSANSAAVILTAGSEDDYDFTCADGTLEITPVSTAITITAASDSKQYDGTALTKHTYSITTGALVGYDFITVNFTGEQTKAGSSDNTAAAYVSVGASENYDIHIAYGTLKVKPNAEIITITAGDTLYAVIEGSRTDVDESANRIVSYIVTNSKGEDVTGCYTFGPTVDGIIKITPKGVTITVSNAVKKYGADDLAFTGDVSGLCSE